MEKPRFDRTYILNELGKISSKIKKHFVKIFLLGGSGLTFYGLKEATKDIDVVSESYSEAKTLVKALVESNYKKVEKVSIPYNKMKTVAIFENKDGLRWDIFHLKVCNALTLSSGMTSRAKEIYRKINSLYF